MVARSRVANAPQVAGSPVSDSWWRLLHFKVVVLDGRDLAGLVGGVNGIIAAGN